MEDEPAVRFRNERSFAERYDTVFAADGAKALGLIGSHQSEVAVLDVRLPDTDGIELVRSLRAVRPALPLIIASAYPSLGLQLEPLDLPHSGYFVKPFGLRPPGDRINAAH